MIRVRITREYPALPDEPVAVLADVLFDNLDVTDAMYQVSMAALNGRDRLVEVARRSALAIADAVEVPPVPPDFDPAHPRTLS